MAEAITENLIFNNRVEQRGRFDRSLQEKLRQPLHKKRWIYQVLRARDDMLGHLEEGKNNLILSKYQCWRQQLEID